MSRFISLFLSLIFVQVVAVYSLDTIQTFAGSSGDGFQAVQTSLNLPYDISDFVNSELLIAEVYNHKIRKVLSNNTIITIAGTGYAGFNGDGQLAVNTHLYYPYDAEIFNNEIYICDSYNNRIRKILSNGTMITVAGGGTLTTSQFATEVKLNFPYGVVVNEEGEIFIADTYNHVIRKVYNNGTITTIAGIVGSLGYNGDGQLATSAKLNRPTSLDIDSEGNVLISDSGNHRIRKVFSNNGTIITIAGNGTAGFYGENIPATESQINSPNGVTFNSLNNDIYIADVYNNRIRKVSSNGLISTLAGNGQQGFNGDNLLATDASLNLPSDIRVSVSGDLLISDTNNYRIRKISSKNGIISTIAGNGYERFNGDGLLAIDSLLYHPSSVHYYSSDKSVYFADRTNHRIRKISNNGIVSTIVGTGTGTFNGDQLAINANINYPHGLIVDSKGTLFISDSYNHRIRKLLTNGTLITIAGNGIAGFNGDGNALETQLNYPFGMDLDSEGSIVFADRSNHRVRKLLTNGTIVTVAGNGNNGYSGDGQLAIQSSLNTPTGVYVNSLGEILIADRNNNRIRKVSNTGIITTIAGTGKSGFNGDSLPATSSNLYYPNDVTVFQNEIYISDSYNHRIRKITTNGTLITVAGNGQSGDSNAEGIPATESKLYYPYDVSFDSNGRMLIADSSNQKIKLVTFGSTPAVSASKVIPIQSRNVNTTAVSGADTNFVNCLYLASLIIVLICNLL